MIPARTILWRSMLPVAFMLVGLAQAGGSESDSGNAERELRPAMERFTVPSQEVPNFERHVIPLLGRLGCNGRSCHGSFQGQGGFRLSMFGFDFSADWAALAGSDSPRVDVDDPAASLILHKPTNEDEHGGGKRFEPGGWEYILLLRWIEYGAKNVSAQAGKLVSLEVSPPEISFREVGQTQKLQAVAQWSDGTREDVTCLTRFSSNDNGIVDVSPEGLVRAVARGTTHIIACYDNGVVATPVYLPISELTGPNYPPIATPTRIDELVVEQLSKMGIVPAELCTDEEFLRRASLDITGTLPTPEEIAFFLGDTSDSKRTRKIEELLTQPSYVAWWTTKLCDLTGLNGNGLLGRTEMAKMAGEQWHHWLHDRIAANRGYDQIARGILLATSRRPGESYTDFVERQTSYCLDKNPADYAEAETLPYYWFRSNLATADDRALAVSYSFLGVRLDCAQCHKHPFDRWSQQDFQHFSAFFDRVTVGYAPDAEEDRKRLEEEVGLEDFKNAAERRLTYRKLAAAGKAIVPWREVYVAARDQDALSPRPLGGDEIQLPEDRDPREALVEWLLAEDNPYFARAFVNRVWAHYFGVGIVHPPDDLNRANPPSNAPLLDYLARAFAEHGYDMRWLHREITQSRTYQLSMRTNQTNRLDSRLFSHATVRRLPAEVVVDAVAQATASTKWLADSYAKVANRKISQQPPASVRSMEYALAVFGKPVREVNCDCERQSDPSLQQAIYLRNDRDLWSAIDSPRGWLAELKVQTEFEMFLRQAYLRTLSRLPSPSETDRCRDYYDRLQPEEARRDILWALLNTPEFVTNH